MVLWLNEALESISTVALSSIVSAVNSNMGLCRKRKTQSCRFEKQQQKKSHIIWFGQRKEWDKKKVAFTDSEKTKLANLLFNSPIFSPFKTFVSVIYRLVWRALTCIFCCLVSFILSYFWLCSSELLEVAFTMSTHRILLFDHAEIDQAHHDL